MKLSLISLLALASAVSAQTRPNVLLLCIDDLRPELKSFGADYIKSPNIDKLAASGRPFFSHYVQAPTCGASRYAMLTGCYGPADNGALFKRAKKMKSSAVPPSLPEHFRGNGYTTVSVGKVSHNPGGLGGPDWNDPAEPEMPGSWDRSLLPAGPWKHPRGAMHGLANGEIRGGGGGTMDVFQSTPGPDTIYPDGLITDEALHQLETFSADSDGTKKPFFLAVGIIRPHLPFGAPAKYMEPYQDAMLPAIPHPEQPRGLSTWHGSGEFKRYNLWGKDPRKDADFATDVRKHYAACVSYADAQVGRILEKLDELKLAENTIVILWGDHGWHLGEHAVWGKHTLFEESLRSPLVIKHPGLESPGKTTSSIVETIDIFPTLCDLAGLEIPKNLDGTSLRSLLENPQAAGQPALSYFEGRQTIRTADYRLIRHPKKGGSPAFELYDHRKSGGETENIAEGNPDVVQELSALIDSRLADSKKRNMDPANP